MTRDQRLPLTETVYYILMSLIAPAHGYLIMSRVEEHSGGQVRLAPGTLYGALENLSKQELITRVPSTDPRRKVYQITENGESLLVEDTNRMAHMIKTFDRTHRGGNSHEEV